MPHSRGMGLTPYPFFSVTAFLTGVCRLISGTFSAVFSEPLLTFFLTVMLMAVVAGLFLYIYRRSKRF